MTAVNFQPLIDLGIPQETIRDLIIFLQGQVCLDLYRKIRSTFDHEELKKMDSELGNCQDQNSQIELLEKHYFQKTGKHFLDSAYEILQQYLDLLAAVFRQTADDLKRLSGLEEKDLRAVKLAVDKKDFGQVKILLDRFLGENNDGKSF